MRGPASAALLLAALVVARPGAAPAQHGRAGSLCRAPETVLFTCTVGAEVVSLCGQEPSRVVYRFGRPGHVELEATDLRVAERAFSGGGETQVYADTPTHRYIVYDRVVRTSFDGDGRHDPQEQAGLVVQSGGQTISSQRCASSATFDPLIRTLVPTGDYAPH